METFRGLVTAICCSLALASVAAHASGQVKPPQRARPAQPPADQKRLAFDRTCAAEIKAAGTRGARMADMFYKDMSNNPAGREELMTQLAAEVRDAQDEQSRAVNLIAGCAIVVTHMWENGERAPGKLAAEWASVLSEIELAAAEPAIDPSRYLPVARTVCMDDLMQLASASEKSGASRQDAMKRVEEMLEAYALPGERRDDLLKNGSSQAKQEMTAAERHGLRAALCSAVTGAAVDGGMTDPNDLRAFWTTRATAFFPAPRRSDGSRVQCAEIDEGNAKGNEPVLLRNTCAFAINAGFCMSGVPAGSLSEVISCEKNRFETHEVGPKGAALIDKVDGKEFRRAACRAPAVPTLYLAPDGTSKFDCWVK